MAQWIDQQLESLYALQGQEIIRWLGMEMAADENGDGAPRWHDASVPYLQFTRLDLELADGTVFPLTTSQNEGQWGLCRNATVKPLDLLETGLGAIFRNRRVAALPTGDIKRVAVTQYENGNIAELRLRLRAAKFRCWREKPTRRPTARSEL